MTDINELAQRMKAAAIRAKAATEDYVANRMSMSVCLSECAEFNDLSDGPDNIMALVEALEARDKQVAEDVQIKARLCRESNSLHDRLREAEKRIAELEARDIQPLGVQLITEAIGAHAYIVGCLQQNRPDLALEESLKWVQGISQAAVMATEGV